MIVKLKSTLDVSPSSTFLPISSLHESLFLHSLFKSLRKTEKSFCFIDLLCDKYSSTIIINSMKLTSPYILRHSALHKKLENFSLTTKPWLIPSCFIYIHLSYFLLHREIWHSPIWAPVVFLISRSNYTFSYSNYIYFFAFLPSPIHRLWSWKRVTTQ